jgi:hypothetical protein
LSVKIIEKWWNALKTLACYNYHQRWLCFNYNHALACSNCFKKLAYKMPAPPNCRKGGQL